MYIPQTVDSVPPLAFKLNSKFRKQIMFPVSNGVITSFYSGEKDYFVLNDKLTTNLEKISNIASLKEGWNGYNARPFSEFVLLKARQVICGLPINLQPDLFPTGRGSIQFEYHGNNNNYLEFELFEERLIGMQVLGNDYDNAKFWDLQPDDIEKIKEIADYFLNAT